MDVAPHFENEADGADATGGGSVFETALEAMGVVLGKKEGRGRVVPAGKVRLKIAYMCLVVTVDTDLADGALRVKETGEVLLPVATELLERQWQRDQTPLAVGRIHRDQA